MTWIEFYLSKSGDDVIDQKTLYIGQRYFVTHHVRWKDKLLKIYAEFYCRSQNPEYNAF